MMGMANSHSVSSLVVALLFILSVIQSAASADQNCYIVYLGSHEHAAPETAEGARRRLISDEHQRIATEKHHRFLASFLGSTEAAKEAMIYSYNKYINGFSAILNDSEAKMIAAHPDVVRVFPNTPKTLHTTNSMSFLNLEGPSAPPGDGDGDGDGDYYDLWRLANFGEGVIIANLDSGVWPESESFSGEDYDSIPPHWNGRCQKGVRCNNKLIGARYFSEGYRKCRGKKANVKGLFSARDKNGHGTHTLSTAGGNHVKGAHVFGNGYGVAKGSAPRAHVASYKVCWGGTCFPNDILQAFEHAVHDRVDVLSLSIGGSPKYFDLDEIVAGAFHAVRHGVAVVASAGNSGPKQGTVSNAAPWILTVAASTTDRSFEAYAILGNRLRFKGSSLSPRPIENKEYPLISATSARAVGASSRNASCCRHHTLDTRKVFGKIVVCHSCNDTNPMERAQEVKHTGGVGMIVCDGEDSMSMSSSYADTSVLPTVNLNYSDGRSVFHYLQSTKNPFGSITPSTTVFGTKPAPAIAEFSSRGPNLIAPTILKPDIAAPGVEIIASYPLHKSVTGTPFNAMSGTSMACPHVAGVVALLRSIKPHWSQAALMSAIITTAEDIDSTGNKIRDALQREATPFAYGSGQIVPSRALDPGLVYDATYVDYLKFLCGLGMNSAQIKRMTTETYSCPESTTTYMMNYPSISVPYLSKSITLTRRVKNVGLPGEYRVRLNTPEGISMRVYPESLKFDQLDESKHFTITLTPKKKNRGHKYVFGDITWSDGRHRVRSPIAVRVG